MKKIFCRLIPGVTVIMVLTGLKRRAILMVDFGKMMDVIVKMVLTGLKRRTILMVDFGKMMY